MSDTSLPTLGDLTPEQLFAVTELCEQFETTWKDWPPRIEDYLHRIDSSARDVLLAELVKLELALRREQGETATPQDFQARFPDRPWLGQLLSSDREKGDEVRSQQEVSSEYLSSRETTAFTLDDNGSDTATKPTSAHDGLVGPPGYEILEVLGRGGMGVVYKARHFALDRIVALKMILSGAHANESDLARFKTEAEAVARLQHPGIVQIHEVNEHEGMPYLSLEFCAGGSLEDKLDGTPLPDREAAELVEKLARAMQATHQKGVIHRDLKPANVLLAEDGTPKITDFGLAKKLDEEGKTATGNVMGTPSYMPPEQAAGRLNEIGPAADVYSLGALLYALLTGRPPFQAANVMDTLMQVAEREPVSPRQLNPAVDRDLETISLKCLQKQPAKRYSSAAELSEDLRRFLRNEPIQARPVSWAERSWRWTKRHPARAGFATVGLLAVVALVGLGVAWNYQGVLEGKNEQLELANREVSAARDQLSVKNEQLGVTLIKEAKLSSQLAVKNEEVEQLLNVRRINLAFEEWKDNEITRAMTLLGDCPRKRRHWEWYYVKHLCESGLLTFRNHSSTVRSVAVSPDGKQILSGDYEGNIKLWDADTGRELRALPRHHGCVFQVIFSRDGSRFATSATDSVQVWNAQDGRVIRSLPSGSRSVSLSPDGKRVAALHQFRTLEIWDVDTGKEIGTLKQQPRGIGGVVFSPDGNRLATVATSGFQMTAHLWNATTGEREFTLIGHDDYVNAVAFSPDGMRVATASKDNTIKIWDAKSGRALLTLRGHKDSVEDIAFRHDGQQIVSCSRDKSIKVWDAGTGLENLTLRGHTDIVVSVAFSPDGQRIVSGSWDKTVRLWDATRGQTMTVIDAHNRSIRGAVWMPDGKQVVTTGADKTVQFRDPLSGQLLNSVQPPTGLIRQLEISSDGKRFVTLSSDKFVRLWDREFRRPLLEVQGELTAMAFSPKGDQIALALGKEIRVIDASNGQVISTYRGHNNNVFHLAYSPDGRRVASASRAVISPDGKSKLWDETVKVWNAENGQELFALKGNRTNEVDDVQFSPDGQRIATANWDGAARVWDADTGEQLLTLRGHAGFVQGVAFSPDRKRIATVGDDDTLRIWHADSGRELLTLKDNHLANDDVTFSPDGRQIMTRGSRIHIRTAGNPLERAAE